MALIPAAIALAGATLGSLILLIVVGAIIALVVYFVVGLFAPPPFPGVIAALVFLAVLLIGL